MVRMRVIAGEREREADWGIEKAVIAVLVVTRQGRTGQDRIG